MLESNLEEVNKMQSLSNYLLSLNKYQNKQAPLPRTEISLKISMEKALKQVQSAAIVKRITINRKIGDAKIIGNELSLIELFVIFLDNAIKYSHDEGKIEVVLDKDGKNAIVEISDQGIGIPEKDMPHIFDRFFRADMSRSKIRSEGYGLGLAIAQSIVEMHEGKIEVKSRPDKGSTFTIILPYIL